MKNKYIDSISEQDSAWKGHGCFAIKLVQTFKPKIVVDLGVDYGFSTFCFAFENNGEVYGIDWFQGDSHAGKRDTLNYVQSLYETIKKDWKIGNIQFIKSDFKDAANKWNIDKKVDILHIDGFHSYEAVSSDFKNWIRHCHDNSIILFHDIESFPDTVGRFFNEINNSGYKLIKKGSAGLGIFTKSKENFEIIKTFVNDSNCNE